MPGRRFKLVANLPYNIATPILGNLLAEDRPPWSMTATMSGIPCSVTGTVKACDFTCSATATPSGGTVPLAVQFNSSYILSPNCAGVATYAWDFGDTTTDIRAAQNAGVRSVLVRTGHEGGDGKFSDLPDFEFQTLRAAVDFIILQPAL